MYADYHRKDKITFRNVEDHFYSQRQKTFPHSDKSKAKIPKLLSLKSVVSTISSSIRHHVTPQYVSKLDNAWVDNRLSMNNEGIRAALKKWRISRSAAELEHGLISRWDTTYVTDMSKLFQRDHNFNEDISGWNVANVTTMERKAEGAAALSAAKSERERHQKLQDWT